MAMVMEALTKIIRQSAARNLFLLSNMAQRLFTWLAKFAVSLEKARKFTLDVRTHTDSVVGFWAGI